MIHIFLTFHNNYKNIIDFTNLLNDIEIITINNNNYMKHKI